ncbi:MAG TPA: FxsA family protein [Iamia sp.]|nr:FxsA family protein [Iamia sp.]
MAWLVALLVLVVGPIAELWFIIQVADVIGGWQTLALLLVEGAIGSWLIKRQGRTVIRRIDERLRRHDLPTKELADGFLILVAGVLMLTPGFLTDIVGFALLFPPTRAIARAALLRRFTARMGQGFTFVSGPLFGGGPRPGDVFDATVRDTPPQPPRRTEILGPGDRR